MSNQYNIYCDESCHLEHDQQKAMVLGCTILPFDLVKTATDEIKAIKIKHGLHPMTEIKWTKVSQNKAEMFNEIVSYFIHNSNIEFRCVLIPDKSILNHKAYNQSNDDFYYKMFTLALSKLIVPGSLYNIYFDYKDKHENSRVNILKNDLQAKLNIVNLDEIHTQLIHSFESQIMQLTDILIGAVIYRNRGIETNEAKIKLIRILEHELRIDLTKTSYYNYTKFNILAWDPKKKKSI